MRECVSGEGERHILCIQYHYSDQYKGALCGATSVDDAFERLLKTLVGEETWNSYDPWSRKKMINSDWENLIKPQFDGSQVGRVDLPNFGPIHVGAQQIRKCFDETVMQEIVKLLRSQGDAVRAQQGKGLTVSPGNIVQIKSNQLIKQYVILAGGFGKSPYVYNFIQRSQACRGAQLIQAGNKKP
jgi:hypothetical protein